MYVLVGLVVRPSVVACGERRGLPHSRISSFLPTAPSQGPILGVAVSALLFVVLQGKTALLVVLEWPLCIICNVDAIIERRRI